MVFVYRKQVKVQSTIEDEPRFPDVPYGEGLIARIRFKPTAEGSSNVARYFVESEPFDHQQGVDAEVGVRIQLTDNPELLDTLEAPALEVVGTSSEAINSPRVQLRVRARGVETLQVSQDFQFAKNVQVYPAASILESGPNNDGESIFLIDYDFNVNIERCQLNALDCEGPRTVFVRAENQGLLSSALEASVVLDTQAPMPTMVAQNGESQLVFERVDIGENNALFEAVVSSATLTDGLYIPHIRAEDRAGNLTVGASFETPQIQIDLTRPVLLIAQNGVSYVRGAISNAAPEFITEGYTIPQGPAYSSLGPPDPLQRVATLPAKTFRLEDEALDLIRVWAEETQENLLATVRPNENGRWDRNALQLANVDPPGVRHRI